MKAPWNALQVQRAVIVISGKFANCKWYDSWATKSFKIHSKLLDLISPDDPLFKDANFFLISDTLPFVQCQTLQQECPSSKKWLTFSTSKGHGPE